MRDQARRNQANDPDRRRTLANETEIETDGSPFQSSGQPWSASRELATVGFTCAIVFL